MATHEQAPASTVTRLRRPPVRQSTMVRSDAGHTFDTFVRTIGVWWPVTTREAAEEFVKGDPFVHHGVVRRWTIREWREALVP